MKYNVSLVVLSFVLASAMHANSDDAKFLEGPCSAANNAEFENSDSPFNNAYRMYDNFNYVGYIEEATRVLDAGEGTEHQQELARLHIGLASFAENLPDTDGNFLSHDSFIRVILNDGSKHRIPQHQRMPKSIEMLEDRSATNDGDVIIQLQDGMGDGKHTAKTVVKATKKLKKRGYRSHYYSDFPQLDKNMSGFLRDNGVNPILQGQLVDNFIQNAHKVTSAFGVYGLLQLQPSDLRLECPIQIADEDAVIAVKNTTDPIKGDILMVALGAAPNPKNPGFFIGGKKIQNRQLDSFAVVDAMLANKDLTVIDCGFGNNRISLDGIQLTPEDTEDIQSRIIELPRDNKLDTHLAAARVISRDPKARMRFLTSDWGVGNAIVSGMDACEQDKCTIMVPEGGVENPKGGRIGIEIPDGQGGTKMSSVFHEMRMHGTRADVEKLYPFVQAVLNRQDNNAGNGDIYESKVYKCFVGRAITREEHQSGMMLDVLKVMDASVQKRLIKSLEHVSKQKVTVGNTGSNSGMYLDISGYCNLQ